MGETFTSIEFYGPDDTHELEALVDTGATFTEISRKLALKIGLKPRRTVLTQLATGDLVSREAGTVEAEIAGVRDTIPVVIGEDHEPAVVGDTTLGILGFKINSITKELEPTHAIEYRDEEGS